MQRSTSQPKRPPLSDAQRAANLANAQHSTGPRSPEGKARAAANALKHGLRSSLSAHSLYLLRGESPDELNQLRASLEAEFRPHSPTQHLLLQQLITTQIRYLRAQRYYVYLLNDQANALKPHVEETYLPPFDPDIVNALAYQSLADNGQALRLLTRDLDRLPTKILRLIHELQSLPTNTDTTDEIEIDTNEPISSPVIRPDEPLTPEPAPEPEPILACSVVNCIQPFHPCSECRPIGEVPRVNNHPDWPPDCRETNPEPIISLLNYHILNPEVENFVNPFATCTNEEIWAAADEAMKNHPDNDDDPNAIDPYADLYPTP